jgi:hypothetical protein
MLNRYGPEPDVFRPEETVELVYENVSVQDTAYIWGPARTLRFWRHRRHAGTSVSYIRLLTGL